MNASNPLLPEKVRSRCGKNGAVPPFPEPLSGDLVHLSALSREDGPALYAASNGAPYLGHPSYDAEAQIWRYMFGGPYVDQPSFQEYIDALTPMSNGLALCVRRKSDKAIAGIATYCNHVPDHLRVELGGIWYSPSFQRTGTNTETIYLMLLHAFETLGYRRVEWKCDALNERSRKAALRLGFIFEGIFAQHMVVKGRNRDTAWFAITDNRWEEVKTLLNRKRQA